MKIDFFNTLKRKKKMPNILVGQLTNKNKYEQFKIVNESYFLSIQDKAIFKLYYQKNIRIYLLLIKVLSKKYENLQRLKFNNDLDMSLNRLRYSTTISLFHYNKLYEFDIFDLLKIIKNALYFNNMLFIETQYPKNPYNNKPFSIGNLINMYLYMRSKHMSIPIYFEAFRKSGFILKKYIEINEPIIKLNCIKNYCDSMTLYEMYGEIIVMLRRYKIKNAIIHPEFPREMVVKQFKPYINNYFTQCYSHHPVLRAKYKIENKKEIKAFFKANPTFGRIIYTRNDPLMKGIMKAETKYKYLNYLSTHIPDYNYFEDIENFNNINENEELNDLHSIIDDNEDDEDDGEDDEDNEQLNEQDLEFISLFDNDNDNDNDNNENDDDDIDIDDNWERNIEEEINIIMRRL